MQRPVRGDGVGVRGHDLLRAMENRVGHQLGARAAFLQAHPRQIGEVQEAQEDDDRADDRRDAENLLAFDA